MEAKTRVQGTALINETKKVKKETFNQKWKRLKTAFRKGELSPSEQEEWEHLGIDFSEAMDMALEKLNQLRNKQEKGILNKNKSGS